MKNYIVLPLIKSSVSVSIKSLRIIYH